MKKIISLLVVLAMLMAMAPAVFAADITGSGILSDPYVYESVQDLVNDWTEKSIDAGVTVYVTAPVGGDTLTVTSDTTAAAIATTQGTYLAYNNEPCYFDEAVFAAGSNVTFGICNQNPRGAAVATLTAASINTASGNGTGAIDDPYIYETVADLVEDWTNKVVAAGTTVYVSAPIGGETLTVTSDTTAAAIASTRGIALAYNNEPYYFDTEYFPAGSASVFGIMNQDPYGAVTATLTAESLSSGSGSNNASVPGTGMASATNTGESFDGTTISYTPTEDGVLSVEITAADPGWLVELYSGDEWIEESFGVEADTVTFDLTANTAYNIIIHVVSAYPTMNMYDWAASGYVSYSTSFEAGNSGSGSGSGSESALGAGMASATNTGESFDGTTISYTPTEDGVLSVEITAADPGWLVELYSGDEWIEESFGVEADTVTFDLTANTAYNIIIHVVSAYPTMNMYDWAASGYVSYNTSFEAGTGTGGSSGSQDSNVKYATADADSKYLESFSAPQDGTLTITVGDGTTAWVSDVMNFSNFSVIPGKSGTAQDSYTIDVVGGTNYSIRIYGAGDPCAAISNVPYTVVFTPTGAALDLGTEVDSETDAADTLDTHIDIPYTPAEDGILSVVISGDPGYKIVVFRTADEGSVGLPASGSSEATLSYELYKDVAYTIRIDGFNPTEDDYTAASIDYAIYFKAAELTPDMEDQLKSDVVLEVGENNVDLIENAIVSLYEFTPAEPGVYTITVPSDVELATYGYSGWNLIAEGENGVLVHTATAAEQTILIGLTAEEASVNVTIEKTGSYEAGEETTYLDYEATVEFDDEFELPEGDFVSVDITEEQTIVLGNDGYYHLGTYEGPVLMVNLNSEGFTLATMFGAGAPITMRGEKFEGEDGKPYCYDYMSFIAYGAGGYSDYYNYSRDEDYYPLNADLMAFLRDYGAAQGWYIKETSNFDAIKAGGFNEDSAWMVALGTIEGFNGSATAGTVVYPESDDEGGNTGTGTGNTDSTNKDTSNSKTGDFGVIAAAVALGMSAIGGTAVIAKKKEF